MIVPMKKICLMVQDKSRDEALKVLRDAGVVHIEMKDTSVDSESTPQKNKIKTEEALGLINEYKLPKTKKVRPKQDSERPSIEQRAKPVGLYRGRRTTDVFGTEDNEPYSLDAVKANVRPYLPDLMVGFGEERKALKDKDLLLNREITRIEEWGDFDPAVIKEIISYGIDINLYEISPDVFARLDKNVRYIKVKSDKAVVRIVVFGEKIQGVNPFHLPEKSLSELKNDLEATTIALKAMEAKIKSFVTRRPVLENEMLSISQDIEFDAVVKNMNEVQLDNNQTTSAIASCCKVSWLSGFVPCDDLEDLKDVASKNSWALSAYDPSPEDAPPTKLQNNKFVRIINPLLSFLGTVPGYREFDISPSYLFFFSIYVAMILGDAGYGVLLLTVALAAGLLLRVKTGTVPDVIKLLMLLTVCTIGWGAINGSWFQIPYANLPQFLKALVILPFNSVAPAIQFPWFLQDIYVLPASKIPQTSELITRWNVQFLCFTLGLIHLVWARGKRFFKLLPKLSAFAQLGSLVMMVGLYFLVLNMLLGIEFPQFAIQFIIVGISFNLIFAEQNGGNFFINLGKGFGNFFQLFLKIVGCFADIISYIRLFAVGLAGAMIAQIFNGMAIPAEFGNFGIMFIVQVISMILILAIGHGLNLALTALSVIVHGVRLNLLEYAGNHLEMEWSGYLYKPFASKQKKHNIRRSN